MLYVFCELLYVCIDELVGIVIVEYGKVFADVVGEIFCGLENVEFAIGVLYLLKGGFFVQAVIGVDVYSICQSLGVVVGIMLFNFLVMVLLWMAANAIVTGNAFVFKLSEKDFFVLLYLVQLWKEVGLSNGVFIVVQGDKEVVDILLIYLDIVVVSFVGFILIVCYIYEIGMKNGKRVQVFGGAKNHVLVLFDVDIDVVVDVFVFVVYGVVGEWCMVLSIAVVVGSIVDLLVDVFVICLSKFMIGDGVELGIDMGLLIIVEYCDWVGGYIVVGE